jgi:hypothetical protein
MIVAIKHRNRFCYFHHWRHLSYRYGIRTGAGRGVGFWCGTLLYHSNSLQRIFSKWSKRDDCVVDFVNFHNDDCKYSWH